MNDFIIKVTLTLKDEQRRKSDEWEMHFKQEIKVVPEPKVCFYTTNMLIALQAFNMDEVESFILEYNRR